MKNIFLLLFALMALSVTSCEKGEIKPSSPNSKDKLKECRNCDGSWDVTNPDSKG